MMINETIKKLNRKENLEKEEASEAIKEIMSGRTSDAEIVDFLTALNKKGESIEEITAFAETMREFSIKINPKVDNIIDLCGTGGDYSNTFNISTISSFVVAGAGVPVAKHGNRSISSRCGSADILEALGADINIKPRKAEKMLEEIGIAFLFAPDYHPAMKYAANARRRIKERTVFNILGPLCNPAPTKAQLIGVYSPWLTEKIAAVLGRMGKNALVVYGEPGMDEISICGKTQISEYRNSEFKTYCIEPEDFGMKRTAINNLKSYDIKTNIDIFYSVLDGPNTFYRNVVLLNSGAALYIAGKAKDIQEGISIAKDSIDSKKALGKFFKFKQKSLERV